MAIPLKEINQHLGSRIVLTVNTVQYQYLSVRMDSERQHYHIDTD